MQAWRILKHGGPEVLTLQEIAAPIAGPLQAVVKVQAVGLNHLDLWVRNGVKGHTFHLPITPGGDSVGTIHELGPGSEKHLELERNPLRIGSPVIVHPGLSCGRCEACLKGFDPLCSAYGILGETQDGGCAEYLVVPITNLIKRPPTLTPTQAAGLGIPFLTAWTMLTRKANLQPGETVLIQAGGSSVSVAAIQIAKLLGATVITSVGSDEKIEKAKKLGADYVIQYRKTPFREEVKKILNLLDQSGCEVVVDHVGADTFSDSLKCLTWGGRFVTCGATSGGHVELNLNALFFKNISLHGSTMGSKGDFIQLVNLVADGKLRPVIDTQLDWHLLGDALSLIEKRKLFGKAVLSFDSA